MPNILFISTSLKIQHTLGRYFADKRLDANKTFVVVEFFGQEIPTDLPDNFLGITDLLNQKELDNVCERLKSYGPFSSVISLSELTIYAAADFRNRLNVDGPSKCILEKFRDKVVMKKALIDSGIRLPRLYTSENFLKEKIRFPIISKPKAYAGSMGVSIINSIEELQNLTNKSAEQNDPTYDNRFIELRINDLQFEEFIHGDTYHIDGLVRNGKIIFSKTFKHINSCLDFINGVPLGNISVNDDHANDEWFSFAEKIIKTMDVPDGSFHLEAFLTPEGERVFLEIAARPPGGMISNTLDLVYGVDLRWEHIAAQLKIPINHSFFDQLDTKSVQSGDLIFPMNYIPEGQRPNQFVQNVNKLSIIEYPTLIQSNYPLIGSPAESDFSYENNLGSFIFLNPDVDLIIKDIERAIRCYTVGIQK